MNIAINTEHIAYTEFRDFIISSADWFVPSLQQMPNLDEWILKMHQNGFMYYSVSKSDIIALVVAYHNVEKHFIHIPYVCVHPDYRGYRISKQLISYIVEHLPANIYNMYLEVRKDNKWAIYSYKEMGFHESEDRGEKYLMKKELY